LFIDRIDLFDPKTIANLYKQRGIKGRCMAESGIADEKLHIHIFAYLLNGFTVAQITNVFDDQTAKCNSGIDTAGACPVIVHLFQVDAYQKIPRQLTG
jgi:hypothetical protein